ncbi:uncharacterized protein PSFLO_00766 [Pseudozyma flocculosa]|uniref:Uncharacterized protein n=1 Tax=Pseudozyma flocculosa TaxID=84751 RepID=A0A5C3EUD7_9BASI|nr:uncharacterized protein PSFLO_00766 [Pseudozyma flocculosa]
MVKILTAAGLVVVALAMSTAAAARVSRRHFEVGDGDDGEHFFQLGQAGQLVPVQPDPPHSDRDLARRGDGEGDC